MKFLGPCVYYSAFHCSHMLITLNMILSALVSPDVVCLYSNFLHEFMNQRPITLILLLLMLSDIGIVIPLLMYLEYRDTRRTKIGSCNHLENEQNYCSYKTYSLTLNM